jgi:hypothetical protein
VYVWFVLLHLVGLVIFLAMHGVSMAVSFWVRGQAERTTIVSLLMLSSRAVQISYLGLLLLGIGGLGAAANVGWLTVSWVVASYVVLAIVVVAMYIVAAPYYYGLRGAIEGEKGAQPIDDVQLRARLVSRRPEAIAVIGAIGLLVLVWLMVMKPGL